MSFLFEHLLHPCAAHAEQMTSVATAQAGADELFGGLPPDRRNLSRGAFVGGFCPGVALHDTPERCRKSHIELDFHVICAAVR